MYERRERKMRIRRKEETKEIKVTMRKEKYKENKSRMQKNVRKAKRKI